MKDFSRYNKALNFAVKGYKGHTRKSGAVPYIIHPLRITSILRAVGLSEFEHEDLFIAALFHDLVEDTDTSIDKIEELFGKNVATIVIELTIPDKANKEEFLRSMKFSSQAAKIIKLADRIDNLSDMSGDFWTEDYKIKYAKQAKIILNTCGDAHKELANYLEGKINKILE